jgi:putative hydrolase of the HAD superfamily
MNNKSTILLIIFDWGNTVMRDLGINGPMKDWPEVEWIPFMDTVLPELNSGFTLAIATSAPHSDTQDMAEALARVGAHDYFHFFFSAFDLQAKKPDPLFFERILEQTGFKAFQCLSIGDKYENDVVAAKSLGMNTILFNENNIPGNYPDADRVITSMDQLQMAIDSIALAK